MSGVKCSNCSEDRRDTVLNCMVCYRETCWNCWERCTKCMTFVLCETCWKKHNKILWVDRGDCKECEDKEKNKLISPKFH